MKKSFSSIMIFLLCFSMFAVFAPKTKAATVPVVVSSSVNESSSSISLPGGADIYLYGYGTGGGAPSGSFSYGQITSLMNQGGNVVAALAVATSNSNYFSTSSGYPVIGGAGVQGFSSYSSSFSTNNSPAAPSASNSFTVTTSGSLVVVIAIGGDEQSLSVSGLSGLQIDAAWPGSPWNALEILHTYLDAGTYVVTEYTSQSAAGQTPAYAGDLIGVFVFTPSASAGAPVISSVSPITATNLQTIYIYGSGFGNTQPQTVSLGDGSVDTVTSSTTPSMAIYDNGGGSHDWSAGRIVPGVNYDDIGIILVSWSDSEIVLGGFGAALGTNGQGAWNIALGDPLTVNVTTPSGDAIYSTIVISTPVRARANFTYSPIPPIQNGTTTFDASSSTAGGTIVSYEWNFDEGSNVTTSNPVTSYAFAYAGNHNVTLTIVDSNGLNDTTFEVIDVLTRGQHDVAVTNVVVDVPHCSSKVGNDLWVFQGRPVYINVTILNKVNFSEYVNVTLYYNVTGDEQIGTENITVPAGETETLSFTWNTQSIPYCKNYTITVVALIPLDNNPSDNTLATGPITVRILGDLNGDGKVDMVDIGIAAASFGSYVGQPRWNSDCDVNGDGKVDLRDIALIAKNFGQRAR